MNIPTIIVLTLVILLFGGLLAKTIYDKKHGKHSCSCGSDCASCSCGCGEK